MKIPSTARSRGKAFLRNIERALGSGDDGAKSQAWTGIGESISRQCRRVLSGHQTHKDPSAIDGLCSDINEKFLEDDCRRLRDLLLKVQAKKVEAYLFTLAKRTLSDRSAKQRIRDHHEREATSTYQPRSSGSEIDFEELITHFESRLSPFELFIIRLRRSELSFELIRIAAGRACTRQDLAQKIKAITNQLKQYWAEENAKRPDDHE